VLTFQALRFGGRGAVEDPGTQQRVDTGRFEATVRDPGRQDHAPGDGFAAVGQTHDPQLTLGAK
jgi:hypothetical protein